MNNSGLLGKQYQGAEGVRELTKDILRDGVWQEDGRTGVKSISMFDAKIVVDDFPFVTDILASPRLAFEELWFFLRGETNTKKLEEKGVHFWKGNTSREFLDSRGLHGLPEGNLGAAYSKQWRNFNRGFVITPVGVDQLRKLLYDLEYNPYSRRHVVSLWNPLEEWMMPITPCWWAFNFVVLKDREGKDVLHMKSVNRSLDVVFGASFALMQQRLLQMALCKMFDFTLGTLVADLSNVHIYENQVEYAQELLMRKPSEEDSFIELKKKPSNMEELLSLEWEDWNMTYHYNKEWMVTPRPDMVV